MLSGTSGWLDLICAVMVGRITRSRAACRMCYRTACARGRSRSAPTARQLLSLRRRQRKVRGRMFRKATPSLPTLSLPKRSPRPTRFRRVRLCTGFSTARVRLPGTRCLEQYSQCEFVTGRHAIAVNWTRAARRATGRDCTAYQIDVAPDGKPSAEPMPMPQPAQNPDEKSRISKPSQKPLGFLTPRSRWRKYSGANRLTSGAWQSRKPRPRSRRLGPAYQVITKVYNGFGRPMVGSFLASMRVRKGSILQGLSANQFSQVPMDVCLTLEIACVVMEK